MPEKEFLMITRHLFIFLCMFIFLVACSTEPTVLPTATASATPSPTTTPSSTATATVSITPSATPTATPTLTPTPSPTLTPMPSPTATKTVNEVQEAIRGVLTTFLEGMFFEVRKIEFDLTHEIIDPSLTISLSQLSADVETGSWFAIRTVALTHALIPNDMAYALGSDEFRVLIFLSGSLSGMSFLGTATDSELLPVINAESIDMETWLKEAVID
jgi:hypothetical protein